MRIYTIALTITCMLMHQTNSPRTTLLKNPHLLTQTTIALLASAFSQNSIKSKLIAHSIGLTCAVGAHLFLNSDYSQSIANWYAKKDTKTETVNQEILLDFSEPTTETEITRSKFSKLCRPNFEESFIGYGFGASVGTILRAGYDATMPYVEMLIGNIKSRYSNLTNKIMPAKMSILDRYDALSKTQKESIDEFWPKAATRKPVRIAIHNGDEWICSPTTDSNKFKEWTKDLATSKKWVESMLESKIDAILAQK